MESQPQNPEFRINPENFHPCINQKSPKTFVVENQCLNVMFKEVCWYIRKIPNRNSKPAPFNAIGKWKYWYQNV